MAWHAAGVLHLDLKPSNIATTAAGDVVVLDAGISRFMTDGSVAVRGAVGTPGVHGAGAARRRSPRGCGGVRRVQPGHDVPSCAGPLGEH